MRDNDELKAPLTKLRSCQVGGSIVRGGGEWERPGRRLNIEAGINIRLPNFFYELNRDEQVRELQRTPLAGIELSPITLEMGSERRCTLHSSLES
ncbi:hypothetical protein CDAR_273901 [Caerostris darwini]|uniref:Uncharacterized protein n=1 Tax=Caerostris darwini TaxID=1538125 RepID=A0AAV4RDL5_9ARAC|nr:hypothetical protein CDAR_273901 [Caerostris darwini]